MELVPQFAGFQDKPVRLFVAKVNLRCDHAAGTDTFLDPPKEVDESTATTLQPRPARYNAFRPGPLARSSARPGGSISTASISNGAGVKSISAPCA